MQKNKKKAQKSKTKKMKYIYRICGLFGADFNLAVILIWQFGELQVNRQI